MENSVSLKGSSLSECGVCVSQTTQAAAAAESGNRVAAATASARVSTPTGPQIVFIVSG